LPAVITAFNPNGLFYVVISGKYYGPADANKIKEWKVNRRITDSTVLIDIITKENLTVSALFNAQQILANTLQQVPTVSESPVADVSGFAVSNIKQTSGSLIESSRTNQSADFSKQIDLTHQFYILINQKKYGPATSEMVRKWFFERRALETTKLIDTITNEEYIVKNILEALTAYSEKRNEEQQAIVIEPIRLPVQPAPEPISESPKPQETTIQPKQAVFNNRIDIKLPLNINAQFFVMINNHKYGPATAESLKNWFNQKRVLETTEIIDTITNAKFTVKDVLNEFASMNVQTLAKIETVKPVVQEKTNQQVIAQPVQPVKRAEQPQPRVKETTTIKLKSHEKKPFSNKWIVGPQLGLLVFTGEAADAANSAFEFGFISEKDINKQWSWQLGLNTAIFKGDKNYNGSQFDIKCMKTPLNISFIYKLNNEMNPDKYYYLGGGLLGAHLRTTTTAGNYYSYSISKFGWGALLKSGYRFAENYDIYLKSTYEKINDTTWGNISLGGSYLF